MTVKFYCLCGASFTGIKPGSTLLWYIRTKHTGEGHGETTAAKCRYQRRKNERRAA